MPKVRMRMEENLSQRNDWRWCGALALLTATAYAGLFSHEFVNYDDPTYIYDNKYTRAGLTINSQRYAWTNMDFANWMPLTWTSLQLSASLGGVSPFSFLGGNLLLHAVNTALVFLVWQRWTGATGASVALAALFAAHPLHVESVAWASSRKDVLSQLFLLLALWFYGAYARAPDGGRYLLVTLFFALSLLSKPIAVTLPLLLLLADYWPLERLAGAESRTAAWRRAARLLLEKAPWLALSLGMGLVTIVAQKGAAAMTLHTEISLPARLGVAAESLGWYVWKTIWPTSLSVMYLHPVNDVNWGAVAAYTALAAALTGYVAWFGRRRKHLTFGWLWFVISLLPVLGLLQVGLQSRADRYTYLPHLGLLTLFVWEFRALTESVAFRRALRRGAVAATLLGSVALTSQQAAVWRNSTTLWQHALTVDPECWVARYMLGYARTEAGQPYEARELFEQVLVQRPDFPDVYASLAMVSGQLGEWDRAEEISRLQVERLPESGQAWCNLASFERQRGRGEAAERAARRAVELESDQSSFWKELGVILAEQGRYEEAVAAQRRVLELRRRDPEAYFEIGLALAAMQRYDEARVALQQSLALDSEQAAAHARLGAIFQAEGRSDQAQRHFSEALRIDPQLMITPALR